MGLLDLILLMWIPCWLLTMAVAQSKGLSGWWCFVGLFFGLFALIAVVGMENIITQQQIKELERETERRSG